MSQESGVVSFCGFSQEELNQSKTILNGMKYIINNPFVCEEFNCGFRYSSMSEMESHNESEHEIYVCEYCKSVCLTILSYSIHYVRCYNEHLQPSTSSSTQTSIKKDLYSQKK